MEHIIIIIVSSTLILSSAKVHKMKTDVPKPHLPGGPTGLQSLSWGGGGGGGGAECRNIDQC